MTYNRRNFLKTASSAATALFAASLHTIGEEYKPAFTMNKSFELKIFATNWGFQGSLDSYCEKAKKDGYDGIEIWWPMEKKSRDETFAALTKHGLDVGFLCGGSQTDWKEHIDFFKKMIDAAAGNTIQKPLYINCHSGRDYFNYEENKAFIDHTTQLAKHTGITICHETHRSRMLFAAPIARQYMEKNPELRLTFDVSHWCNVSESLLHDQQATVELAIQRTEHVHARIGHAEGPQVNDPRAPEWEAAVKAHLNWWDQIAERKKRKGERMTILTEFGPPDYMPTLPYTRSPLADQWEINRYMMQMLRKRYLSI